MLRSMTGARIGTAAAIVVTLAGVPVARAQWAQSGNPGIKPGHTVTLADWDRWKTELSNWGRWGKADELGTVNLITPAKRKKAAALVREGFSVSLARQAETEPAVDNPSPYVLTGLDGKPARVPNENERVSMAWHGVVHTHFDSLSQQVFDGKSYNGHSPEEGTKGLIRILSDGVFTRGVLIDIPRLKGVPYLEPGTPIYVEDLEAWERKAGIKVSAGDALFIRTGRWARRQQLGPWPIDKGFAGLDASVLPWLRKRDVAILAADEPNAVTPVPLASHPELEGLRKRGGHERSGYLVHAFVQVVMGVHVLDHCDLERIAEAAAKRNRWEFLLTVAPLPIPSNGSPVNPVATF